MAEQDFKTFVQDVANGPEEARLALANQLKKAGLWTGKVSANMDTKFYNALVKLEKATRDQQLVDKMVNSTKLAGRYDVLTVLLSEGSGGGDTGAPTTTASRYITSPSQTAKLLNTVAQDLLGRKLTKAEAAKYTKLLNSQQEKQPAMTTSGKGFTTTRGGVDEETFITEQIGNTAEAKKNKATDVYSIMLEELGGLQ